MFSIKVFFPKLCISLGLVLLDFVNVNIIFVKIPTVNLFLFSTEFFLFLSVFKDVGQRILSVVLYGWEIFTFLFDEM